MAEHNDFGRYGEERAIEFLIDKGYKILERNWMVRHLEIDIICEFEDLIVIIEVKSRVLEVERPWELIGREKRRNLLSAGAYYLKSRGLDRELRFDLIIVSYLRIEHIIEAVTIF